MRLVALLALVCVPVAAAPRVSIELLPHASGSGDALLLGQVAHVRSGELDLVRRLVRLPIGRLAPVAGSTTLDRERLAPWILSRTGLQADDVAWTGALRSQVLSTAARTGGKEIGDAAVVAVQELLAATGAAAEARVRALPRDMAPPLADVRLQARPLAPAQLRRSMVVWVDVWSADRWVRTVPVGVVIASQGELPGALVASPPPPRAPAADAAEEARAQRPVAVARGDWATLRSVAGAVSLESRVEVLQDGRPGDRIRVRQSGGNGTVFARVVAAGQLELAP
jgi:flagella basal body P-ring formation protein FlgA